MVEISLCMIVRNEEAVLERCLQSASKVVDEIIIVDTGSTDNTKKIAKQFTNKIYDFDWIDDFSAARNFSFSKATKNYVMWLDADDVIENKDICEINNLKRSIETDIDIIYLKYNISFDERGNPTFSYLRERIIKNCEKALWIEPIHEVIIPFGKTYYSDAAISHKKIKENPPKRNLGIFENQIKKGFLLSPRLQYYYGRELMYNGETARAVEIFENFLSDNRGWIENNIGACLNLSQCYNKLGQKVKAVDTLLRSFVYDAPRAEICCEIARHFFEENKLRVAEYWYKSALNAIPEKNSGGFIERDFFEFIPAIQLAVLYDRLGDNAKAMIFNDLAGQFKPNHPAYLSNKSYFSKKN